MINTPPQVEKVCPSCTCPYWNVTSTSTADLPRAWKDVDGTWYNGPDHTDSKYVCSNCGWTQRVTLERGKAVQVIRDTIKPTASTEPLDVIKDKYLRMRSAYGTLVGTVYPRIVYRELDLLRREYVMTGGDPNALPYTPPPSLDGHAPVIT